MYLEGDLRFIHKPINRDGFYYLVEDEEDDSNNSTINLKSKSPLMSKSSSSRSPGCEGTLMPVQNCLQGGVV